MSLPRMPRTVLPIVVMLVLSCLPVSSQTDIVDLGTLGGEGSYAHGINDRGQVVGWSATPSGELHAFLWTPEGGMQDLGTLGGVASFAYGINSQGQVAGWYDTGNSARAFLWTAEGGMQDLGTLGGRDSWANGINDRGQVIGESLTASHEPHAFLWDAAVGMQDLGTLGGPNSAANGINAWGQVVGSCTTPSGGRPHACLWPERQESGNVFLPVLVRQ